MKQDWKRLEASSLIIGCLVRIGAAVAALVQARSRQTLEAVYADCIATLGGIVNDGALTRLRSAVATYRQFKAISKDVPEVASLDLDRITRNTWAVIVRLHAGGQFQALKSMVLSPSIYEDNATTLAVAAGYVRPAADGRAAAERAIKKLIAYLRRDDCDMVVFGPLVEALKTAKEKAETTAAETAEKKAAETKVA